MLTVLERRDDGATPIGWCQWYPYAGDPDAANLASRRVLERAGFAFVELRSTSAGSGRLAIYRLAPAVGSPGDAA